MESPRLTGTGHVIALPHLWAPLLVLFAGLVVTGLTAQALEEQSRSLAEQVYRKQHNALVARLRGYDELPPLYTDGVAPARTINNVAPAEPVSYTHLTLPTILLV